MQLTVASLSLPQLVAAQFHPYTDAGLLLSSSPPAHILRRVSIRYLHIHLLAISPLTLNAMNLGLLIPSIVERGC